MLFHPLNRRLLYQKTTLLFWYNIRKAKKNGLSRFKKHIGISHNKGAVQISIR